MTLREYLDLTGTKVYAARYPLRSLPSLNSKMNILLNNPH